MQEDITRSIDRLTKAVGELKDVESSSIKEWKRAASRVSFNVDTLTQAEVQELRWLIAHEDELSVCSTQRLAQGGPLLTGMYQEFERLGLLARSSEGLTVLPMAHWAVEKFDQWEHDEDGEREEQWRHDVRLTIISTVLGAGLGILGTLLGVSTG